LKGLSRIWWTNCAIGQNVLIVLESKSTQPRRLPIQLSTRLVDVAGTGGVAGAPLKATVEGLLVEEALLKFVIDPSWVDVGIVKKLDMWQEIAPSRPPRTTSTSVHGQ